ncbi:hypothetical protein SAMN05421810_104436 [Amycolatopsis arida]|uniref:Acyl-CoA dehydrogenase n=1 Tax=Amycolatopsis arida TaxID=587909 RepID=A0A1I5VM09_9PSEU|nr:acyl-CoA dehydrogenase family protein [Amycolatopsis arida]TDX87949.1 hypothetical protein CLV69_11282 [Amycolatopsis arida]SFQ08574.1 hypothetical protein SAMN05421810_104436 [Amycolatopsis arida]
MDFTLDDDQRAVADLAAEVLDREVTADRPGGAEHRDEPAWDEPVWRALAKAGLLALTLPPELDGDGLGMLETALVLTEVGRAAAPVPALSALALGVLPVGRLGTPEQRATLLPPVAAGEALLTAALHEPSAPLPTRPVTTATPGTAGWTLTGTVTTVPFAAAAERILVPATGPDGAAVFLVDPRAAGVTVVPAPGAAGAAVRLDRADAEPLGRPDRADAVAVLHRHALAGAAALGAGALAGALDLTTRHVAERHQFGRPLAAFQAVAQQVADVYVAARTLRLAALSAAWRLSTGADPDSDLEVAAYWLAEEAPRALATCHHLHGGLGVDVTYPLHRHYTTVKDLTRCVGGAAHRLDRLGERVAG